MWACSVRKLCVPYMICRIASHCKRTLSTHSRLKIYPGSRTPCLRTWICVDRHENNQISSETILAHSVIGASKFRFNSLWGIKLVVAFCTMNMNLLNRILAMMVASFSDKKSVHENTILEIVNLECVFDEFIADSFIFRISKMAEIASDPDPHIQLLYI